MNKKKLGEINCYCVGGGGDGGEEKTNDSIKKKIN